MPHFKAFGMMILPYEIGICHKIHNKGTMSQLQIQVTIFLSRTDVISEKNSLKCPAERSCCRSIVPTLLY